MIRGSDSTMAKSSMRPPMTAGPMERNLRFCNAASCEGWAQAVPQATESASTLQRNQVSVSLCRLMGANPRLDQHCTPVLYEKTGWELPFVRRLARPDFQIRNFRALGIYREHPRFLAEGSWHRVKFDFPRYCCARGR